MNNVTCRKVKGLQVVIGGMRQGWDKGGTKCIFGERYGRGREEAGMVGVGETGSVGQL